MSVASRVEPGTLGAELLLATRTDDQVAIPRLLAELGALDSSALARALPDDGSRMAFWIDIYNASVQLLPIDDLASRRSRFAFFRREAVTVAGHPLSLDAIEHGLLRRSRWKLGLGYAANPRPSSFERAHRVSEVDPRIHFALNCGAVSCPPIATYRADRIDAQLDVATRGYLQQEGRLEGERVVRVPALFLWFRGDFGGRSGMRRFLEHHGVEASGRSLRFERWDWTPRPGRWASEPPDSTRS